MNELNILSQYTLALMAGISCLVLIIVQGKDNLKSKLTYRATFMFVLNIVFISLLLYILYSFEVFINNYNVFLLVRLLDYITYALLLYSWIRLVEAMCIEVSEGFSSKWCIWGKRMSIAACVLFMIIVIFFMNNTYYIADQHVRTAYHTLEIVYAILGSIIILICLFTALELLLISHMRFFVIAASVFIVLYLLIQIPLSLDLGGDKIGSWDSESMDYSGWFLFMINIASVCFVYKKDFQKVYTSPEYSSDGPTDIMIALDTTAQTFRLTHREREVTELIYKGMSNAEIASELNISIHTVKSHVKNIFEKVGVSTRMELTYIVNNERLRK